MFDGLGILGLIMGATQFIKEATEKEIPAEYWNNKELMRRDRMRPGISEKDILDRVWKGRYYAPEVIPEKYEKPKPKIIDKKSYERDIKECGKKIADEMAEYGFYSFILDCPPKKEKEKVIIKDKKSYEEDIKLFGKSVADERAKNGAYMFVHKEETLESLISERQRKQYEADVEKYGKGLADRFARNGKYRF